MSKGKERIYETAGNIFADIGLPDAETHLLKAQIASELFRLGISQPEVSRLFKGQFSEYSVERLMEFLTAFDRDVEIIARPRRRTGERGRIGFRTVGSQSRVIR